MTRYILPAVLFAALASLPLAANAEISGQAELSYQKNTSSSGGKEVTSKTFNQGYTLGFSKYITPVLSLSGDVRLSVIDADGVKRESTYPMLTLSFSPPRLYDVTFGYTRTETAPAGADPITTANMNAGFFLPASRWPSLSMTMNRTATEDYLDTHKVNAVFTSTNLTSGYSRDILDVVEAKANYALNSNSNEDKVGLTTVDTLSHNVTAELSSSMLDNRLRMGLNAGYGLTNSKNTSQGQPTRFEIGMLLTEGLYAVDATPLSGALAAMPGLIDGNMTGSVGIDIGTTGNINRNMGLRQLVAHEAHKLRLYLSVTDSATAANMPAYVAGNSFGFQVYSSADGVNWTLLPGAVASYDSSFSRVEFTFPEATAEYFKIVSTANPVGAAAVNVTEIEALGYVLSTPQTVFDYEIRRQFGGFNLSYAPWDRLNITYSLSMDSSFQGISETDTKSMSHGVNIRYIIMPRYLSLSSSFSNASTSTTQSLIPGSPLSSETGSSNYSFTLSATPLKTLSGTFSYGHFSSSSGASAESINDSVSATAFMNLYTGVDVGLGTSMSKAKNTADDSTSDSSSYNANIRLLPWNELNVLINSTYYTSESRSPAGDASSTGKTASAVMTYSPTRRVYATANYTLLPDFSQGYSFTWLPTRNIQAEARYGSSELSVNKGASLSWSPFTRLSLNLGYSATVQKGGVTEDSSSSIYMRGSLRF